VTNRNDDEATLDAENSARSESSFSLHSLQPHFVEADHGLYVTYLESELKNPSKSLDSAVSKALPRNIALTGSYGSGKSSVLAKLEKVLDDRVVSVSLSTLGKDADKYAPAAATESSALKTPAITNAIQKEIVKQLLYREKPSKVPGSRYRRIEAFRPGRAVAYSVLLAFAITSWALISGVASRLEVVAGPNQVLFGTIYAALFLAVGLISFFIQRLFHNRVWIEKLSSGPASISLSGSSTSFFDEYLDELVYFFEVTKYDVVIFEDLDRFNDPYIFETLRELNTILNSSKQIAPKTIRFVYAIKDSIFEQLGKISIGGSVLSKKDVQELAVTNRTKFFDLVLPIVPFISHRNSRDLISQELSKSGFKVSKPVLDLVSKHLVDMRLIKNIHNEFGVFKQKILGPEKMAELTSDVLFAMVVYKNLHMADFEEIRRGQSAIDGLYRDYRSLINTNISRIDSEVRRLQRQLKTLESVESRSVQLGDELDEYVTRLLRHTAVPVQNASVTFAAVPHTVEDYRKSSFWTTWLADETVTLQISTGYPHNIGLSVSLADLRKELRNPIESDAWATEDTLQLEQDIAALREERDFLKPATMKQLFDRPDLKLKTDDVSESFDELAKRHLPEGLALSLVSAGYIDRNFSLYVSLYYGDTVTAKARNFILHSVDPNVMDVNGEIGSAAEIDSMLDEVGSSIFTERSVYNVQLFDHLLEVNDSRLSLSIRKLANWGEEEQTFVQTYLVSGSSRRELLSRLAGYWDGIFVYIASHSTVSEGDRLALFDAALQNISQRRDYDADETTTKFIEANYQRLEALSTVVDDETAAALVKLLEKLNVELESLDQLSDAVVTGAVQKSLYALTEANLVTALHGEVDLTLDKIQSQDPMVFSYVSRNLNRYLEIQDQSATTDATFTEPERFIPILSLLAEAPELDLLSVVERAPSGWQMKSIKGVAPFIWPALAATSRMATSYTNVTAYLEIAGGAIDEPLAKLLSGADVISDTDAVDEADKLKLASAIVNCVVLPTTKRVQLISSINMDSPMDVSEVLAEGKSTDVRVPSGSSLAD